MYPAQQYYQKPAQPQQQQQPPQQQQHQPVVYYQPPMGGPAMQPAMQPMQPAMQPMQQQPVVYAMPPQQPQVMPYLGATTGQQQPVMVSASAPPLDDAPPPYVETGAAPAPAAQPAMVASAPPAAQIEGQAVTAANTTVAVGAAPVTSGGWDMQALAAMQAQRAAPQPVMMQPQQYQPPQQYYVPPQGAVMQQPPQQQPQYMLVQGPNGQPQYVMVTPVPSGSPMMGGGSGGAQPLNMTPANYQQKLAPQASATTAAAAPTYAAMPATAAAAKQSGGIGALEHGRVVALQSVASGKLLWVCDESKMLVQGDATDGSRAAARWKVHAVSGSGSGRVVKLESVLRPGRYLRIGPEKGLNAFGDGGPFTEFVAIAHDDGSVSLQSKKWKAQSGAEYHVGVLPNGNRKNPEATGQGPHGRFKIVPQ